MEYALEITYPRIRSTLFNVLCSFLDRDDRIAFVIKHELRVLIGNGLNVAFWTDNWLGVWSLKSTYPRIFALAWVKVGLIANFGY